MTSKMKDKLIAGIVGMAATLSGVLLMWALIKSDAQEIKNEDKLKTDIKIEVKDEIKPELEKKLDKIIFNDYVENQEKDELKLYRELDQIQQKQNETNKMLLELMKLAKK